jgi:hypothetical protein
MSSTGKKPLKEAASSGTDKPQKDAQETPNTVLEILRIGILRDGRISEERMIKKGESVWIGSSEKNDFVILSSALPPRFEMFPYKKGKYALQFTEKMHGKLQVDDNVFDLHELRKKGLADKKGKFYIYPIAGSSKGKILIGDSSVLFQFVPKPKVQPRPQLPVVVRGNLLKTIEWRIAGIWLLSLAIHATFFTWLRLADWPVESKWEKFERFHQLMVAPEKEEEKKEADKEDKGEAEKTKEEKKKEQKTPKKSPVEKAEAKPQKSNEELEKERRDRRAEVASQLAERGINKIIGSLTESGDGDIRDVLGQGDVGADQDALLSQVSGVGVATSDSGKLNGPAGGTGTGEAVEIGQVEMKGADAAVMTQGAGQEKQVRGDVKRKNAAAVEGTGELDSKEVNRIIGQKMAAVKGCYERALRRDPNLKGKLVIRFTISGSGKVTSAEAIENDLTPEVGTCVADAFKRFRFPEPEGGSLTMESPFMFLPSN